MVSWPLFSSSYANDIDLPLLTLVIDNKHIFTMSRKGLLRVNMKVNKS
uniref:Uncharacterized protein n=1 Tax=Arundo donax TaxID=35708 RepID=A0A0A9GVL7_ARUDO